MCKEPSPIRLHSSVVLPGLGAFSPKPGLQKMASSFRVGLVRGEACTPGSSTVAFLLQCKQSLLSSFCSAKTLAAFCLQLRIFRLTAAGQEANQAAAIAQYELRAKSCWGRRLLPQLSVLPPYAIEEVTEELVPEEHEAGGQCSLHQARGQALEEALGAFLL